MFFVEFGGNVFDGENDEEGDDNEVVQLPKDGNEVGYEVKGRSV
jgi:hypothetical protein